MASATCPKCDGSGFILSGQTVRLCWMCVSKGVIDACDCKRRPGLTRSVPPLCLNCGKVVVG